MDLNPEVDMSLVTAGKHRMPHNNNCARCCIDAVGIWCLSIHDLTTASKRPTALVQFETAQKLFTSQLSKPCTKSESISNTSDLTKCFRCTVCACTGSKVTKSMMSNRCNLHFESSTGEPQDWCNARNVSDPNASWSVNCTPGLRKSATPHTVQSAACKSLNISNEIVSCNVGSGANRNLCKHSFKCCCRSKLICHQLAFCTNLPCLHAATSRRLS